MSDDKGMLNEWERAVGSHPNPGQALGFQSFVFFKLREHMGWQGRQGVVYFSNSILHLL